MMMFLNVPFAEDQGKGGNGETILSTLMVGFGLACYEQHSYKHSDSSLSMGWFQKVIDFPRIVYAMRSLVPVGHFRNTSGHLFTWLVCGSFR